MVWVAPQLPLQGQRQRRQRRAQSSPLHHAHLIAMPATMSGQCSGLRDGLVPRKYIVAGPLKEVVQQTFHHLQGFHPAASRQQLMSVLTIATLATTLAIIA